MGAICGIFCLDEQNIKLPAVASMFESLTVYQGDYKNTWQTDRVFFGCQVQYHTPESIHEKMPYFESTSGMTITADAILDNREELGQKLGINPGKRVTDSYLILKAYQKWGQACPTHLLGDFAFAIWDGHRGQLFCSVDHTGNRTLYYHLSPRLFAFATLMNPLFATGEIAKELSDPWICDFLSIPSVIHQLDGELTPYNNIKLLPAGHCLTVSRQGAGKHVYWQVDKIKELKLKSNQAYEEALRQVLGEAVRCRLRTTKPVGIMLSGGLDSTSVGAMAASELMQRGCSLQAFSTVPLEGYQNTLPAGMIADETPYIEKFRKHYNNIDVTYCRFPGKHALSDSKRFFSVLEQPYKILENLFWIDGILAQAKEQNIGIMLTGGMGNTTISYGIFKQCALSLLLSGKWIRLFQALRVHAELKKKNPWRFLFDLVKALLPDVVQKTWYQRRNLNWSAPLELSPINPRFAEQMGAKDRFKQFHYDPLFYKTMDAFAYRQMMLAPFQLSHLAVIYTKLALSHNMIIRDPTIDKRVIEFCLSVPVEQYIGNGRERSLLRRAMQGIVPDEVRLNHQQRGRQSADFVQRLQPLAKKILHEGMKIGGLEKETKYLDIARIHRVVNKVDLSADHAIFDYDLRMLLRSIIFSRFLKT